MKGKVLQMMRREIFFLKAHVTFVGILVVCILTFFKANL